MSKRKKGTNKVSLKQNQATTQVSQPKEINSDTENVQFISEGIGLADTAIIEGINNSNNVVKGEENEMNKTQEVKRNHAEVVVEAKQQEEQAKVASAVKKVEAAKQEVKPVEEPKEKTVALTEKQIAEIVKNAKELAKAELQLEQAKDSKKEIISAKVEGGKQEMYKQQNVAMNSNEVQVPDNNTVTISKADLDDLIKKAVENAAKANANLPAPQVAITEEVKEEPKKEEVVEKKETKEESEENDYSFFFGAAVGAAAVYGGQKLYEYLNDDSADDATEAFSLISDMF